MKDANKNPNTYQKPADKNIKKDISNKPVTPGQGNLQQKPGQSQNPANKGFGDRTASTGLNQKKDEKKGW